MCIWALMHGLLQVDFLHIQLSLADSICIALLLMAYMTACVLFVIQDALQTRCLADKALPVQHAS